MVLREPNDPLNQSRGIMGPLENATGVQNNRGRLRQRFDLIRKLGQGTYGKVQLGIDKETGQEVAIKTIKKSKIETEADLIRIRREIQIMSSVRHPNIIHIYEVFENREKMVLVMEYAAGGELYDYLNERKVLQDDEARRIFRQIASAVYYCHKHKICHRDLKLENILLDEKFNAKIADFGLSNVFDDVKLLKTYCGSPLYASPEIVRGTPYKGPEVDCWSLGVLLYTLVYGSMPFDGSNFKRLVKQISHGDYYEPKKPAEASPLIRIMLTVDPKKRADIRKVCNHPWVNQGSEKDCLAAADELAMQTPVRLDLLLALANCSAISHNQVVVDQPPQPSQPGQANDVNEATNDVGATNDVAGDQHAPKKPKRSKMQSKSKSSPMLELIHDADEDLEMPAAEEKEMAQGGVDQCDTLSEISEIQTLAEDVAAEGNGAATNAEIASKTKPVVKRDPSKVKEPAKKVTVPAPAPEPVVTPTPPAPTQQEQVAEKKVVEKKVKKTEPESQTQPQPPKQVIEVKSTKKEAPAPAASTPPAPTTTVTTTTEEEKKKKPVKPSRPSTETAEKPKVETKKDTPDVVAQPQKQTPVQAPTTTKAKDDSTAPSSREVTPAPPGKEKSATPTDKDSGESGEEGKAKARLKDRADSVSPTRIERRNSKVISQKTAELIQNLETKVSPSGTSSSMEPPPKPPGIKKIVIPNFKVSDAKSKFESKPPRPLTTSVSRSKAAFEAKLQSQSSVEEKSPPKVTPPTKGDSPPAPTPSSDAAKTKPTEPVPEKPKEDATKTEKVKTQDAAKPTVQVSEAPKPEPQPPSKSQPEPAAAATPAPKAAPPKVVPGKVQPANIEKVPATPPVPPAVSEVKPVLMDSGSGTPRKAVMVVKGKASSPTVKPLASPSQQLETPAPMQAQTPICVASDDQPSKSNSTTNIACNDMGTSLAPESCTEGETGKTGATPPTPLGPAAAAKQKLLSKLPPAPSPTPVAAPLTQSAQNGSSKELAVKNITSAISKIVNSGSASKGLNTEDGPKKFATLPKAAKPESEKIVRTEVSFPVSAPEIPLPQVALPAAKEPAQKVAPNQPPQPPQSKQERIIPIKFVDETVNSTPTTAATPSATPSASVTSVTSRAASVTPGTPLISHRDSTGSLFSRQDSSDAESCSVATQPPKMEPIRKCPREFLIPIKLEGSGQTVTPKEELTSGGSTADVSQAAGEDDFRIDSRLRSGRFARPKRYSSLLSDSSFDDEPSVAGSKAPSRRASATTAPAATPANATHTRSRSQGDEPTTPGGTFKRYRNRRHNTAAPDMPLDRSDSFSSAEEDEEDAFQVLTAESLFSNLLDRVRNLTRRINRDDPMMTPNWSTDPATFGLWGASPLREFMTSRAPSETRSFTSSAPGSYRRESSVSMNSTGAPGGAWRRSLSRDLSDESNSGHSASINTANAQSRSQLSRLSSDLFETSSSRSLPLSTRRSPSYLSHRSVDADLGPGFGSGSRTFSRTLSHTGGEYNGTATPGQISRTLPLRRSLKTFDRGPQHVVPEYEPSSSSSSMMSRHSLLDSKYETPGSYLTRLRSQSRDRHGDREGSVARMRTPLRTLYPSGEANGWEGGQDATSSTSIAASTSSTTSSYGTMSGVGMGGSHSSISPISTAVSLDSESMYSGNNPFSYPTANDDSPSRLLSVQEKMNNYSQYYQSLTQRSPFRRLPLASPSQIHANANSGGFGVGLSEIKNLQSPISANSHSAFTRPGIANTPLGGATQVLKIDPTPEVGMASSNSDEGSATPCIQSPVSNPLSSVTSPSISPPQIPSPVPVTMKQTESPEEQKSPASKPPTAASSSIPRWPAVSVRQHRPLSISSFPDGPRASSVSRVMSPPPIKQENGTTSSKDTMTNGSIEPVPPPAVAALQKRRDTRATSVERITRLLERKSMPREVPSTAATPTSAADLLKKKAPPDETTATATINGEVKSSEPDKGTTTKKPKFLQNLEKKWERLTHSGSTSNSKSEQEVEPVTTTTVPSKDVPVTSGSLPNGSGSITNLSTPASPEPFQAGGTSEESSSHEDKINESVLLRRALSPEKKVKATNRIGGGTSSGGTVNFMLGKFKKLESSQDSNSSNGSNAIGSRIPTGRPPVSSAASRFGSVGRRVQMPYTGATSDSVLTMTASFAKETGRSAESPAVEENGMIKNAATVAQEKRRAMHGNLEVKKDVPTTQEGPSPHVENIVSNTGAPSTPVVVSPPQIQIQDSNDQNKVSNEPLPQLDMLSLSPISVSDDTRTESDEGSVAPTKSNSGSAIADEPESVSDRIFRKSFYNRFNASGIDRNKRSHSVTPGSSRRAAASATTGASSPNNNLRVNTNHSKSNGSGGHSPGSLKLSNSPSSSTVASAESKDSTTGSEKSGSTHNRSTSPYLSGLNKYNPNPLFKELMLNEDYRANDVCKKTEYSRKITSKLSKLLREIESDLNSCQLTKTESDDGDSSGLLYCPGRFPHENDAFLTTTAKVHQPGGAQPQQTRPTLLNRAARAGSALPVTNINGNI